MSNFKRSTLLKVMSIILIILGVFSILGNITTIVMSDALNEYYAALGVEAPSTFTIALSIAGTIIILVSGIMGVASKSKKTLLIIGSILCAYYVVSIISTTVTAGFSALNLVGLIVPILYMWGWYQSN